MVVNEASFNSSKQRVPSKLGASASAQRADGNLSLLTHMVLTVALVVTLLVRHDGR